MVTIQFLGSIDEVRKEMELFFGRVAPMSTQPDVASNCVPTSGEWQVTPAPPPVWPDYPAPATEAPSNDDSFTEAWKKEEVNKVKRHRRTRAEMEAARAAEAALSSAIVKSDAALEAAALYDAALEATVPLAPATFADVENALREILTTDGLGVSHGRKFLEEGFGVKRLSLIDEARWPEFVAKANALVAGAGKS